jgi:Carboxypeptidase regulatory-like domain
MPSLHCSRLLPALPGRPHTAGNRLVPLSVVGFLLLFGTGLWAQQTTADVLGTVTDMSGGVLPGVKITVHNLGTGADYTTTSDNSGNYTFPCSRLGVTVSRRSRRASRPGRFPKWLSPLETGWAGNPVGCGRVGAIHGGHGKFSRAADGQFLVE